MGALISKHPVFAALLAIIAVLLVIIAVEAGLATGSRQAAAPALKVAAVDAKLLPPLDKTPPEQAFPETGARPLFIATRRPAPAATTASASMVKGQFVLHGVMIDGDNRVAMLKDKSGRTHRVAIGKDVNGVTVASIEPERVTLRQGDDQEVVALLVQRASGEAVPAVAQPAPVAAAPVPGPFPSQTPPTAAVQPGSPAPGRIAPGVASGSPVPTAGQPSTARPPMVPGQPPAASGGGAAPGASGQAAPTQPPTATLTPEELIARRRAARRAQQAQ